MFDMRGFGAVIVAMILFWAAVAFGLGAWLF